MGHRAASPVFMLCLCLLGTAVASAQTIQLQASPAQGTASAQDPAPATPPAETPATSPPDEPQEPVAVAQVSEQRGFFGSLFSQLGQDLKHMPRRNSLYWLAAGSGLALAVHPADDDINARLVGSDFADAFFAPGKVLGNSAFIFGASAATYIVGRASHKPRVRHMGMDFIEAAILSEGITQLIKVAVRRDRPVNPDGSDNPGYAFPSGHATITFAAATVFQQHFGWKAAVPTYLVASYVAISRLHDNRHFASDVAFGASNGIIIGRSVTWHGRHNFAMTPTAVPGGGGLMVMAQF
jgi:membrane-associated phospholipid phosphatase